MNLLECISPIYGTLEFLVCIEPCPICYKAAYPKNPIAGLLSLDDLYDGLL